MLFLLVLILLIIIYFYGTRNHDYWLKRNIKCDTPVPLFGNHFKNAFAIKSICDVATDLYRKYPNEKVVGYYVGTTPHLLVRDPDIARHILNVDFAHFYPRGLGRDIKKEPLLKNLFNCDGDLWKLMRQRLTPAFTTAKLKNMFPIITKCSEKLQIIGDEIVAQGGECDVRELMARFSTEFIGACGLGIDMDTINNENSFFRQVGRQIFTRSLKDVFFYGIYDLFPEIRAMLSLSNKNLERTFIEVITKVFEQRDFKHSGRNDFVDLLMDLSTKGKIVGESIEYKNPDGSAKQVELEMDLNCLIAQVFVFFAAGFETSSSSTSYTLHQLAFYPDIQQKVQEEIDQVLSKYNGKLCYDAIAEMSLLDMAFKESLRMFPPVGVLNRVCANKYTISQIGVTIDAGIRIMIPIQAIQTDQRYFQQPEKFIPERFAADQVKDRDKYIYLPFGEGPRACIGGRLGHMQSLAGLAAILSKFSVEPSAKTRRNLEINPRLNITQAIMDGLPLKLTLRKQ